LCSRSVCECVFAQFIYACLVFFSFLHCVRTGYSCGCDRIPEWQRGPEPICSRARQQRWADHPGHRRH
jgi:hypothetical protein